MTLGPGRRSIRRGESLPEKDVIKNIGSELSKGMALPKCKKCGCMEETLEALASSLSYIPSGTSLRREVEVWLEQMEPTKYTCLGCAHCFPAETMNALDRAFPGVQHVAQLSCSFEASDQSWPPVAGEYSAFCDGPTCPVAVSTLGSIALAETLASNRRKELCIVGKTETENIGVDKIIKNTITNPTIRFLILAGKDSEGHQSGRTLHALSENGVDENMKVIGSPSHRPILRNVTREEVDAFRKQVKVVDMIGCEDNGRITAKMEELSESLGSTCGCEAYPETEEPAHISGAQVIRADAPAKVEMDKAGYFVIIPQAGKGTITVEHYSYDNRLLRVIEGETARSIYWTIIENGWITQLSHAAYLGKELEKAELSMKMGFKYVQDGA